jgi:hypothetical protein
MDSAVRNLSELTEALKRSTTEVTEANLPTLSKFGVSDDDLTKTEVVKSAVREVIWLSKIELLKEALRTAVQLEFATIPPYLTALWSIIDQAHPVAKSIRAVVHEEMLHLSLLCNLLAGIGEEPRLTGAVVPTYPSRLPGGVHPELLIALEGYGPSALATFMELERPEKPIPIKDEQDEVFPEEDKTIGRFYAALLANFEALDPPLSPDRQIAGPFTWFVMTEIAHVQEAIGLIMAQGEGAVGVPYTRYPRYLSHYYRFKSMAMGVQLGWDEKSKLLVKGDLLPSPSIYTLAPAPKEGYGLAAPHAVRKASEQFDQTYSAMLRLLEASWQDSGDKSFVRALEHMFDLASFARTLMQTSTPDGRGHSPTFHYRP